MDINFRYGQEEIQLKVPDDSHVYAPSFDSVCTDASEMLLESITNPVGCLSLRDQLGKRRKGQITIVVSDITRPIPYHAFLPALLAEIEKVGISKDEVIILVATGMHRPSTMDEKIYMFGKDVVDNYKIVDHDAENETALTLLDGKSWSGSEIRLNSLYVDAGFRIVTGLVEPHFMAGFSGGRKAICPGLVSLQTVHKFHGYKFLSHPCAANTILEDNPCHLENTSIAHLCPADFSINIILDQQRKINSIISGDLFESHQISIDYVREKSCIKVDALADVAITSSGGYPLDATFYQCVKGFVNCLPALKERGEIISFGGCTEGTGSPEYTSLMKQYAFKYQDFIDDISNEVFFIKDQWQFQMHARVLDKIGINNLHFYTTSIPQEELALFSVNAHAVAKDQLADTIQRHINEIVANGKKIAVFPEGPYCSPFTSI